MNQIVRPNGNHQHLLFTLYKHQYKSTTVHMYSQDKIVEYDIQNRDVEKAS